MVRIKIRPTGNSRREVFIYVLYGLLYDTANNIWKPFAPKLLQRLGGSELELFLLTSLPGLTAVLSLIPSAMFIARYRSKKRIIRTLLCINRGLLLVAAAVPFLPGKVQPLAFVLLVALINFPDGASQNAVQSSVGEMFEETDRVKALSVRIKLSTFLTPFVTMLTGFVITRLGRSDGEAVKLYQIFFAGAFLLGLVEIAVFRRMRIPENMDGRPAAGRGYSVQSIVNVFRNKPFVRYCAVLMAFNFLWLAGGPLNTLFMLNELHVNELWLAVFSVITGISALATADFWNNLIFRRGNNTALILLSMLMPFNLGLYLIVKSCYGMCVVQLLNGLAVMGCGIVILNGVYEVVPANGESLVYIGVYNTLYNLTLFLAPFLSYWILDGAGLRWAIVVVASGRVLCSVLIWTVMGKNTWKRIGKAGSKRGKP